MTEVGIDAMEVWVGNLKLDLPKTFAPNNGEDPDKYTKGLGLYSSSFPDSYEDIVTMAANAAFRLMDRNGLEPADIGRIDVATETAFDKSKPVSTYVAGCLEEVYGESLANADKGERKFACIAGTQSINDAYNWIASGRNRGRGALVIATDTALYERGDAGEATQGAGAVAMFIDEDPDIVTLSREQGIGSADETDFLKPNQQFPSVDGHRSMQVYLARMREALEDYKSVAGDIHPEDIVYGPFHTPFPGMVKKAAVLAFRNVIRDTEVADELESEVGRQPEPEDYADEEDYLEALREYTDALRDTDRYQAWYAERIRPTLRISREVGNWYTGSVHVARASALLHALENDRDIVGEQMIVGSYGSGAQAEIHAETIQPNWKRAVARLDVDEQLEGRYDLSFPEYEEIHDNHNLDLETEVEPLTTPDEEFVFAGWGPMGERKYRFVA